MKAITVILDQNLSTTKCVRDNHILHAVSQNIFLPNNSEKNPWISIVGFSLEYGMVKSTNNDEHTLLCHTWPRICSVCRNHNQVISSCMTYHRVCNKSNTTGSTCGAGTVYLSGAPESPQSLKDWIATLLFPKGRQKIYRILQLLFSV
jgi:hypothetical protein